MQVQLNITKNNYQNPNFNARFSKKAEVHLNKELKRLANLSKDEMYGNYYTECIAFAKDLINKIKNINLDGKATLIDINKSGDKFEVKKYRTAVDMLKENYEYSETTVDKHMVNPLIDVLLAVKNTLSSDKQEQADDEQKYNKIKRLLDIRPDREWTGWWSNLDVRDTYTDYVNRSRDGQYYYKQFQLRDTMY